MLMAISRLPLLSYQLTEEFFGVPIAFLSSYRLKKTLVLMLLSIFALPQLSVHAVSRTIANPQLQMVGARVSSLGVTNPTIQGDTNAVLINPASLGDVESMPLTLTSKTVAGEFQYRFACIGLPLDLKIPVRNEKPTFQRVTFGLVYGDLTLSGIPKTILDDQSHPQSNETFSSGTRVLGLSAGTAYYNKFSFDILSVGTTVKMTQMYNPESSPYTFGTDIGAIGTQYWERFFIDKLHIGLALHNVISPSIKDSKSQNEALLPFEFYAGVRADMLGDRLSLFGNNGLDGFTTGFEYFMQPNLILRGSTDFERVNIGTGIIFEKIATGFGDRDFSLRFDYNYTQNRAPLDANPNHVFSVTILGETRPRAPRILTPAEEFLVIPERTITLKGVGPKNTSMQIFNNNLLSRTVYSDKFGKWSIKDFPLNEGKNLIFVKAYSLDKDSSQNSYPLVIFSDTKPPFLTVAINPEGDNLRIKVNCDENIPGLEANIGTTQLTFEQTSTINITQGLGKKIDPLSLHDESTEWECVIPMPEDVKPGTRLPKDMMNLHITAKDSADNTNGGKDYPFFLSFSYPQDKHVHYKDSIRFIGKSSDTLKSISINDKPVFIDPSKQFAMPVSLKPGKNTIRVKAKALNDNDVAYSTRVLYLKSFPDLNDRVRGRREIEFLATLGVLSGDEDGNFNPLRQVTREYIAKLLVLANGTEASTLPKVTNALFSDVPSNYPFAPYIQAAIQSGLMFAYPDGTFKPSQPLTLSESVFLLSNAGIIAYQEVDSTQDHYITRSELAEFLAYSPEYEKKIQNLINWDKGYE